MVLAYQPKRHPFLTLSCYPPAGQSGGKYEVVMVGLPSVLVRVVGGSQVYLTPEGEELLLESGPELEALY